VLFSSSFSSCPYKPIVILDPLQFRNERGSQPDARVHLDNELLVTKMLVTRTSI